MSRRGLCMNSWLCKCKQRFRGFVYSFNEEQWYPNERRRACGSSEFRDRPADFEGAVREDQGWLRIFRDVIRGCHSTNKTLTAIWYGGGRPFWLLTNEAKHGVQCPISSGLIANHNKKHMKASLSIRQIHRGPPAPRRTQIQLNMSLGWRTWPLSLQYQSHRASSFKAPYDLVMIRYEGCRDFFTWWGEAKTPFEDRRTRRVWCDSHRCTPQG